MLNKILISTAALAGLVLAGAASAQTKLDLNNPDDVFKASMKQTCSLVEGKPVLHWWEGKVYGRRPGEKDRHLFNVQGMNVRACKFFNDPKRGPGYQSHSREVMLHLDPKTNAVIPTWENPWTGEVVDIINVANDPVSMSKPVYGRDENGKPTAVFRYTQHKGSFLSGGGAARLFYKNPLAGDYQEYIGGDYHAMEFGTDAISVEQMLNASDEITDAVISWGRVSTWLPWMKMGDRDGVVIYHTAGMRAKGYEDLPEPLASEIKKTYPIYLAPPQIGRASCRERV